jgi:broad specificity phosphatase PhoE
MATTVFLVRHGVTEWDQEGRVQGQRDLPLVEAGILQAEAAAELLSDQPIVDVLCSPLIRCVSTAERIAAKHRLQPARDMRLTEFQVGPWAGMTHEEVARDPLYQRFIADPLSEEIPGGETLRDILDRGLQAMEQAMRAVQAGDSIAIVTHAGIIRVLLAHYLGSPPANYHLLRVNPGSISVLEFTDPSSLPRVLAVNHGTDFHQIFARRAVTETGD